MAENDDWTFAGGVGSEPFDPDTMVAKVTDPNDSALSPAIRAFLSHATSDKAFVEIVARKLGRQRVQYDNWVFENGAEFTTAVQEALSRSAVFVLFASRSALQSLWVRFEAKEAAELSRTGLLKSTLVLIIDAVTRHSDLPRWMQ